MLAEALYTRGAKRKRHKRITEKKIRPKLRPKPRQKRKKNRKLKLKTNFINLHQVGSKYFSFPAWKTKY